MLQLNFDFISHNFGSKFFFFFNSNTMAINTLLSTNFILIILIKLLYNSKDHLIIFESTGFSYATRYFTNTYTTMFLNLPFVLWVYLSFISFIQFIPFSHLIIPSTAPLASIFFLNILIMLLILFNLVFLSPSHNQIKIKSRK